MLKFAASFKQNLWKMAWLTRTAILESIPILVSVIYSGKCIAHILAFDIRNFSPSLCKCSVGKEMWASSNRTDLKNTTNSRTSRYIARDTLLMLFKKLIPRIQRDLTRALRMWTTRHTAEHGERGKNSRQCIRKTSAVCCVQEHSEPTQAATHPEGPHRCARSLLQKEGSARFASRKQSSSMSVETVLPMVSAEPDRRTSIPSRVRCLRTIRNNNKAYRRHGYWCRRALASIGRKWSVSSVLVCPSHMLKVTHKRRNSNSVVHR